MIALSPYLVYKGNCEEAFNFYKLIFSGEILYLGRYKDVPQEARKFFPNAQDEHIMHGSLKINDRTVIMGNDSPETPGQTGDVRDFYLYIDTETQKEAIRIFNELSAGGTVLIPIAHTFWSGCYGVLTDKFGIRWKITSHQND